MADKLVSIDEFLNARKDFVKSGDILVKAAKAPPTWNEEARTARFVMSAEVEDRDRDIIVQEGLDLTEFEKNPIAPFQHQSYTFPVGTWSNVQKMLTGRPKRLEGDLTIVKDGGDGVADRLAFHIGQGTIRCCSIGFIPRAVERREVPEEQRETYYYPGYKILEAELLECSPVSIPANPAALAKSAARGDVLAKEMIEEILDNWVKSDAGLIMPREEFERAHREANGDRTIVTPEAPKGFFERLEGVFAKAFPPNTAALEAAARQAESEAADLAARKDALAGRVTAVQERAVALTA